jgi:hypothetical protein
MKWNRCKCDGLECVCPACGHVSTRKSENGVVMHSCGTRDPGPGTELKLLLASLGFAGKRGCKCGRRAAYMDAMGCDWCEQNTPKIVGWLREEHKRQGSIVPFATPVVDQMVRLAIRRARKKGSK